MVAAQHAHLRAAAGARALDRGAGLVEDVHVADRPRRRAVGAVHPRAARPDRGEVVADAAAAPHRLGRLAQRDVDAGLAVDRLRDRITHGLHEAVDQRHVAQPRPGGGADPPAGDEPRLQRLEEQRLPDLRLGLDLGQRPRDPSPHRPRHVRAVELALRLPWRISRAARRGLRPARAGRRRWRREGLSGLFMGGIFRCDRTPYLACPSHLLKLCVGCDSVEDLTDWQAARLAEARAAGDAALRLPRHPDVADGARPSCWPAARSTG